MGISESDFLRYKQNLGLIPKSQTPAKKKPGKYRSVKVAIDGHVFDSKWEGQCYCSLMWQYRGGFITEPLLQVPFSLGVWHTIGKKRPRKRFYVADFVFVDLKKKELIVADAKGFITEEYEGKKKEFEKIYGICIREFIKNLPY